MNKGKLKVDIKKMPLHGDLKYPEWIQGPQGPVGPEGPMGPQGPKGDPGDITTMDYERLQNKPSINSVSLSGNKGWVDLGLTELDALEVANIWKELL